MLENLINTDTTEGRSPGFLYEGKVSQAPDTIEDPMYVICDDIGDGLLEHGPAPWNSRGEVAMPEVGDKVLVAFLPNGNPWIIGWWPYG